MASRCSKNNIAYGNPSNNSNCKPSIYAGFAYCPYCHSNYTIKTNHYNGVKTKQYLICASNQERKVCKSDNIFIEQFDKALIKELGLLKDNLPGAVKK